MTKKPKIVAIIPARAGSKRIPHKNIRMLDGKPMIYYAIRAALKSKLIDRVIVSSDSEKIIKIARKFGAEVIDIRPKTLANDKIPMLPVIQSEINRLQIKPELIVVIQPTSPFVSSADLDNAVKTLKKAQVSSCVSVMAVKERPEWTFKIKGNRLVPNTRISEARTQELPALYCLNGALYVSTYDTVMKRNMLVDYKSLAPLVMPRIRSSDIDDMEDFDLAEAIMKNKLHEKFS